MTKQTCEATFFILCREKKEELASSAHGWDFPNFEETEYGKDVGFIVRLLLASKKKSLITHFLRRKPQSSGRPLENMRIILDFLSVASEGSEVREMSDDVLLCLVHP